MDFLCDNSSVTESHQSISPSTCSHTSCLQSYQSQSNPKLQPFNDDPGKLLSQKTCPLNAVRLEPKRYKIKKNKADYAHCDTGNEAGAVSNSRKKTLSYKRSASEDRTSSNSLRINNVLQRVNSRERSASAERERLQLPRCQGFASDAFQIVSSPVIQSQHRVPPSTCSHTGCYDIKCSHVSSCYCHSQSNCKHQPLNSNPGKLHEHTLEQKTSPLNAVRLEPKREMIKEQNAVLHISKDSQVIVEVLKDRERKVYVSEVFVISTDGMKIKMYKPQRIPLDNDLPPPLPSDPTEIKSYDFQNLPKIYHNWYLRAKQFVDALRANQPKVIFIKENFKFILMENSPDPDSRMEFYNGGRVIKRGRKITITNNLGEIRDANDLTENPDNNFNSMLEKFLDEKKEFEAVVQDLDADQWFRYPFILSECQWNEPVFCERRIQDYKRING